MHGLIVIWLMEKWYANFAINLLEVVVFILKQHLTGIRGQVKPCEAPNELLGPVTAEYLSKFEKFEENMAREKAIQDEIARKRELLEAMKESGYDDYEIQDSSSIPSTNDPFHYVHPSNDPFHYVHPSFGQP